MAAEGIKECLNILVLANGSLRRVPDVPMHASYFAAYTDHLNVCEYFWHKV